MATKVRHFTRLAGLADRVPGTIDSYPGTAEVGLSSGLLWSLPESWGHTPNTPQTDSYSSNVPTSMSGNSQGKSTIQQALEQVKSIKQLTPKEFKIFQDQTQRHSNSYLKALVADEYVHRLIKGI